MKYCVYKFMNKSNEEIYIGKAKNLKSRLNNHTHLTNDCYNELAYIMYTSFETAYEMDFAERYYIQKTSPKYNTILTDKPISFACKELDEMLFELYKSNEYVVKNSLEQIELLKAERLYLSINLNVVELIGIMTLFSSQAYRDLIKDKEHIKSLDEITKIREELSTNNVRALLMHLRKKYFLLDIKVSGSARTLIERIDFKSNECILDFCYKPKHENSYEKLKLTLKLNE